MMSDIREFLYKFCDSFSQQPISQATLFDNMRINPGVSDVDSSVRTDYSLMKKITGRDDSKEYFERMTQNIKNRQLSDIKIPDWLMKELTEKVRRFKDNIDQWVRIGADVVVDEEEKTVTCYARHQRVRGIDVQWVIYCLSEWTNERELDYRIRMIVPGEMSYNKKLTWLEKNYDKLESVGTLFLIGTPFHYIERGMMPIVKINEIVMNPLVLSDSNKNKDKQRLQIFPQTWANRDVEISAPGWTLTKEEDSVRVFLVAEKNGEK